MRRSPRCCRTCRDRRDPRPGCTPRRCTASCTGTATHLRTQALRVVPEHADGLRPTSRPGPKHRAMPATTPPGIAAPATAAPDATPGILAPDDQRPRWRPGDRMEHLFEQRCDATPHHPAVEPENGPPLTFAELDARANRLARHLRARGIGAGDRVALMFDDAVWAYTAMLAALKVGAAFVPLDPGFPADRVGYIVSDAAASAVLTLEHLRADLDEMQADVLCVDDPAARLRALPARTADPGRARPGERRPARLHHLHVRLDRPPQGRRDRPPEHRQLRPRRGRGVRRPARRPDVPGHDDRLRLLRRGDLGAVGRRRDARAQAGRRVAAGGGPARLPAPPPGHGDGLRAHAAVDDRGGPAGPAVPARLRRGLPARPDRALAQGRAGGSSTSTGPPRPRSPPPGPRSTPTAR